MPIHDWQFWAVTIVMCIALFMLRKVVFPKKKGKRTNLTISAKKQVKDDKDCGCS